MTEPLQGFSSSADLDLRPTPPRPTRPGPINPVPTRPGCSTIPDEVGPDELGPDELGPDALGPDALGPDELFRSPWTFCKAAGQLIQAQPIRAQLIWAQLVRDVAPSRMNWARMSSSGALGRSARQRDNSSGPHSSRFRAQLL